MADSGKHIRWLVVGYGRAARCHIAAIRWAPNAELAGVVTRRPVEIPDVACFTDLARAIDECRPDAIIIATPHDHHVSAATMALQAGVPVLCEKPVGRDVTDAEAIVELSGKHATHVGVVLNQRGCHHHRWIRERVRSGEFRCRSATILVTVPRLGGWNADKSSAGGGGLRTVGLHYLDLLCWWFGQPDWVAGSLAGAPMDDIAHLVLHFANDVHATLVVTTVGETFISPPAFLLQGDTANIQLRGHTITALHGLPDPPDQQATPEGLSFGPGHLTVIQEATAQLLAGKAFPVSLAEAMPVLTLLDEIYGRATATGCFVSKSRP